MGVSLTLTPTGFAFNTVGAVGNSVIDVYDKRFGSAFLSLTRHFGFYGLGKTANKLTGEATDQLMLEGTIILYDKLVLPVVGDNYNNDNPNSTFERIEYKRP